MKSIMLRYLVIIVTFLLIWQCVIVEWQIPAYFLPTPLQVFKALYQQRQVILIQTLPTLIEISLGLWFGILLGCFSALTITYFRPLRFWFMPLLIVSQAIPTFAIAPLLVMWLGYGLASKIVMTVMMIFFPVASAMYDGLTGTPNDWLDLARTMNASALRVFWYIRLPAALPALASGIRIAAVTAPVGAIVGEWVGGSRGLGYLMLSANARMQIDMMFAALIVIMALALTLYIFVDKTLRAWITWVN